MGLLTLAEAAEALRIDRPRAGRWLKLRILEREAELGRHILVRKGRSNVRQHYMVNMQMLRRWYPDVVDGRDELIEAAHILTRKTNKLLVEVDERLDEIDHKLNALVDRIDRLRPERSRVRI